MNKHIYLNNFISVNDYDFIFIVETWMMPDTQDSLVCPSGYDILRSDRTEKRGGGVLVLFKSNYTVTNIVNENNSIVEHICIDLRLPTSKYQLRFLCLYCPPESSRRIDYVNLLINCISSYGQNVDKFFLFGDFNMPTTIN